MTIQFLVLDSKYYDGTEKGYQKAYEKAKEITVSDVLDIDDVIKQYRIKYPEERYDFDDIKVYED